jgi:hypothetical protein
MFDQFSLFEFITIMAYGFLLLSFCLVGVAVSLMFTSPQPKKKEISRFADMTLEEIFYSRFPFIQLQQTQLTFKQANARVNFLNKTRKRNYTFWVACARVINGEQVEFMVLRDTQFLELQNMLSEYENDSIVLI